MRTTNQMKSKLILITATALAVGAWLSGCSKRETKFEPKGIIVTNNTFAGTGWVNGGKAKLGQAFWTTLPENNGMTVRTFKTNEASQFIVEQSLNGAVFSNAFAVEWQTNELGWRLHTKVQPAIIHTNDEWIIELHQMPPVR